MLETFILCSVSAIPLDYFLMIHGCSVISLYTQVKPNVVVNAATISFEYA